jgi:hypothetical protein
LTEPRLALTWKDFVFCWTPIAQHAFETLKKALTSAPVILHPDPAKPFIVEIDVSDFAIGVVLSQADETGTLHPVSFYSRKVTTKSSLPLSKPLKNGVCTWQVLNNLMYDPDGPCRNHIMKECHDNALAGHFSVTETFELISRSYWWPQSWKLSKEFVKTCDTCARAKPVHHRPCGLLQPLPNTIRPLAFISSDFITDLLETNGFNSVLVVVDRFTKMTHFILCSKTISGIETTNLLLTNIVRLHGLPDEIIFYCGPQFMSNFWKRLFKH